jgi:serine/threonine protein kinase
LRDFEFPTNCKLGGGRASTVYRVRHVSSGVDMALKCYFRSQLEPYSLHAIRQEIALHSSMHHPAVTSFYGWFEDERGNIYLVLELAKRGDVFNAVYNDGWNVPADSGRLAGAGQRAPGTRLSESHACRAVIRPLVSAVAHIHAKGIMHRGIKLENVLVTDNGASCKLADFGFAVNFTQHRAVTRLGTLEYMVRLVLDCLPIVYPVHTFHAVDPHSLKGAWIQPLNL